MCFRCYGCCDEHVASMVIDGSAELNCNTRVADNWGEQCEFSGSYRCACYPGAYETCVRQCNGTTWQLEACEDCQLSYNALLPESSEPASNK